MPGYGTHTLTQMLAEAYIHIIPRAAVLVKVLFTFCRSRFSRPVQAWNRWRFEVVRRNMESGLHYIEAEETTAKAMIMQLLVNKKDAIRFPAKGNADMCWEIHHAVEESVTEAVIAFTPPRPGGRFLGLPAIICNKCGCGLETGVFELK